MTRPSPPSEDGSAQAPADASLEPTFDLGAATLSSTTSRGPALSPGTHVGKYLVLGTVGRGGMGAVYAAYDPHLDRRVALKVLHPDETDEAERTEGRTRLLREAQALAKVSHPNVVHVHDVGTFGDQVYLAMEYVSGVTLRDWLSERPRSVEDVLFVMRRAGRGLAAAHAVGLVHRDFKPDNVLVDKRGHPHVLDFGLARAVETPSVSAEIPDVRPTLNPGDNAPESRAVPSSGLLSAPLTRAGHLLGTPGYMAPEQIHGLAIDGRTDQFSFGVTLFEALYGARPFEGATVREQLVATVHHAIPPPPKGTKVPKYVHRIIERALTPRPEGRYSSMNTLLDELGTDPRIARRRAALVAGMVGVVVGAVFVGRALEGTSSPACGDGHAALGGVWDDDDAAKVREAFTATGLPHAEPSFLNVERTLDAYADAWASAHKDACEATIVRGDAPLRVMELRMSCLASRRREVGAIVSMLAKADADTVTNAAAAVGSLHSVATCRGSDETSLGARVLADPERQAAAEALEERIAEARAEQLGGRHDAARAQATELVEAAETLGHRPLEAESSLLLGEASVDAGKYEPALTAFERSAYAAQASGQDEVLARALAQAGITLGYQLAKPELGMKECARAEAVSERLGRPAEAAGLVALCRQSVFGRMGKYEDQRREALVATERFVEAFGERHPKVAAALNNLGAAYTRLGDYDRALEQFQRSAATWEAIGGPNHPELASPLTNIGIVLRRQAKYEEALAVYQRVEDIHRTTHGENHPDMATLHNNLAVVYSRLGRVDEALERYQESYRIKLVAHGPEHPAVATALVNMGIMYKKKGDLQKALELYEQSLAMKEKTLGRDHPGLANVLGNIAEVLRELKQPERALVSAERAVTLQEKVEGKAVDDLAPLLTILGECQFAAGKPKEALVTLERAVAMQEKSAKDRAAVGSARFVLAKVRWEAGSDRARARDLASLALADYRAAAEGETEPITEIEAWIAAHR